MPLTASELGSLGQSCELILKPDFREENVNSHHFGSRVVMPPDGWLDESSVDADAIRSKPNDELVCCSETVYPDTDLRSCANHRVKHDACKTPYELRDKSLPLKFGRARIYRKNGTI